MSTKRSLVDELQSVMLDHCLDAPEPTATVDGILASTVAATRPVASRRRRFPSPRLIGAAAAVALLVSGIALANANRSDSHKSSSTSGVGDGSAVFAPNNQQQGTDGSAGSIGAKGGQPKAFSAAEAATPPCPPPWTNSYSSTIELPADAQHGPLSVVQSYCAGPLGKRSGTVVMVSTLAGTANNSVTTLIDQAQQLQVLQIHTDRNGLTVRAGHASGVVTDQRFSTTDGRLFTAGPASQVAAPCARGDLAVSLQAESDSAGTRSRVIEFRNQSAQRCAIDGFPGVAAQVRGGQTVLAGSTLRQPDGSVLGGAPSIVILEPGGSAHARISYADRRTTSAATPCMTATSVTISLAGSSLVTLPFATGICDLQVDPVQPGASG